MNDRQNAKITMYQTVYNTCTGFASVYTNVPAFINTLEALNKGIRQIREVEKQQVDALSKGATQAKTSVEEALIQSLLKVSGTLYVYAFETGNKELAAKMNLNKSQLFRMEDNTLLVTASEIASKAAEAVTALTNFGIGSAELTELAEHIAEYESLIVKPRTVIGEHKLHTANLTRLFAETDSLLYDKLDKLINLYKVSSPDFYNSYKNARNVINLSIRRRKPEGEA
ncbi:MAG: hypothetical protein LBL79_01085 [Prevotella sp.]|jgi:hypothetical protein|nr:hypothetical protein [Prevotella sp.]